MYRKFNLCTLIFSILLGGLHVAAQTTRQMEREKLNPAASEKRTALVIGNGRYTDSPLRNPVNDATDMTSTLRSLGFEVLSYVDLDQNAMKKAIRDFGVKLRTKGGVGLFYYAGHGVQVKGVNYLIPIGAAINTEEEIEYESVDVGAVLAQMESAKNNLNLVILDACRNNPFARSFRSSDKGLASINAPSGTLIAYSTAPGSVAADGAGKNGIYTAELLKYLRAPNLGVEEVFKRVRISVLNLTGQKQTPWESSSLTGDFYFKPDASTINTTDKTNINAGAGKVSRVPENSSDALAELDAWNKVKTSTSATDFQLFLQKFPNGSFAKQAGEKIRNIGDPEWTRIKDSKDPKVFRDYTNKNPNSYFVEDARERMNFLTTSMIEWERIRESKNPEDFSNYIAKYPDGVHTEEAKKTLEPFILKLNPMQVFHGHVGMSGGYAAGILELMSNGVKYTEIGKDGIDPFNNKKYKAPVPKHNLTYPCEEIQTVKYENKAVILGGRFDFITFVFKNGKDTEYYLAPGDVEKAIKTVNVIKNICKIS